MDILDIGKKHFFEAFGFLHLRGVIKPHEVMEIRMELLRIFDEDRSGEPYEGNRRQQIDAVVEHSQLLAPFATDSRILTPVNELLGDGVIWIGSDANLYVGDTGWHSDGSNLDYRRIKALFYLDALTLNTGALQLIAGSHRAPMHSCLAPLLQRSDKTITPYGVVAPLRDQAGTPVLGTPVGELPAVGIATVPGDVVLFDQNIWHSSYGGSIARMMFTMNYGEDPTSKTQKAYVREMYEGQLNFLKTHQLTSFGELIPDSFAVANGVEIDDLLRLSKELGF